MANLTHAVAVDLGASSGRTFLAAYDGERLLPESVHRFSNGGIRSDGLLRWPAATIFDRILEGLGRAAEMTGGSIETIGVDGWGVDFALLDRRGDLIADPVHHRDERTIGVLDQLEKKMSAEHLYLRTGIPPQRINTLVQLLSDPGQMEGTERLLFIPDLFQHWLSGSGFSERSIASTSQLLAVSSQGWDAEVGATFGVPPDLMPPLVRAGTDLGPLLDGVSQRVGLPDARVVMPAAHDTASAALAVPREPGRPSAWVSSGTWSVVGVDADRPVTSAAALRAEISNEPSPDGKTLVTRNVMGMWLLQECRRTWADERGWTEPELVALASQEPPCSRLFDPDDPILFAPGDMPTRIRKVLAGADWELERPGRLVRCVLESLAVKTRWAVEQCAAAAGVDYGCLHVVGGGSEIAFLNQLLADFTGRPVLAGPREAAVLGSAAVQLLSTGRLGGWSELSELIRASQKPRVFEPSSATSAAQDRFTAWASLTFQTKLSHASA